MMSVMSKPVTGKKGYQVTKVVCAGAAVAGFAAMSEHINAASGEEGVSAQKIAFGGAAAVLAAGLGYFVYSQVQCSNEKNVAFVFVKPHACTDAVSTFVKSELEAHGIKILKEGEIDGNTIDKKMYIDQHYYAIASKATIMTPKELEALVPAAKFEKKFGITYAKALAEGKVYNAMEACKKLGVDADGLDKKWAAAKKADKLEKFGGGFYCGDVEGIYVFNGFFMSMRSKFTGNTKIHYYVVEWDKKDLDWADFRGKVLGPTDPADGPRDSIRAKIAGKWKEFGLKAPCDVGDNGVHASASPFEALAEVTNWLEGTISAEDFGKKLLAAGVSEDTIKAWRVDPQVSFEKDGKPGKFSLFDSVEDLNSGACLDKLVKINNYNKK